MTYLDKIHQGKIARIEKYVGDLKKWAYQESATVPKLVFFEKSQSFRKAKKIIDELDNSDLNFDEHVGLIYAEAVKEYLANLEANYLALKESDDLAPEKESQLSLFCNDNDGECDDCLRMSYQFELPWKCFQGLIFPVKYRHLFELEVAAHEITSIYPANSVRIL